MFFEYLKVEQFQDSIEIESIGNCCLQSVNDMADCWILVIKTDLGISTVIEAGTYNLDFEEPSTSIHISKTQFEYNERRLHKVIHDFINNSKRNITSVEVVDVETCKNLLKKLTDSL